MPQRQSVSNNSGARGCSTRTNKSVSADKVQLVFCRQRMQRRHRLFSCTRVRDCQSRSPYALAPVSSAGPDTAKDRSSPRCGAPWSSGASAKPRRAPASPKNFPKERSTMTLPSAQADAALILGRTSREGFVDDRPCGACFAKRFDLGGFPKATVRIVRIRDDENFGIFGRDTICGHRARAMPGLSPAFGVFAVSRIQHRDGCRFEQSWNERDRRLRTGQYGDVAWIDAEIVGGGFAACAIERRRGQGVP